jgi:CxxC-x17-CxxC domain-containing protein
MGNFDKGRSGGKSFGGKPSFGGSRGGKSFGGGDRGGRPSFGGRDGGRREERSTESFKAVCDSCHKSCEVPFRPTTGKPVYCNDCFAKNRDFDNRPSFGGRDNDRGGDRGSFSPRNDRNDRPARRDDKPAFSAAPKGPDTELLKKQVDALHIKMDTMMRDFAEFRTAVKNVAVAGAPVIAREVKKDIQKVEKEVVKKAVAVKKEIVKDVKVAKKAATKVAKKVIAKVTKKVTGKKK